MKYLLCLIFILILLGHRCDAQLQSKFGSSIPPQTTLSKPLRVLVAFVEFDQSGANCLGVNNSCWQSGARPDGLPFDVDNYFDPYPSTSPQAYFSKYYYEASFGKFIVVGDYLKNVVRVPCSVLGNPYPSNYAAINQAINTEFITNGTAHGFSMADFDFYTTDISMEGMLKPDVPDNKVDFLIILYGNSRDNDLCGVGHGCGNGSPTSSFIIDGYEINSSCDFFMCGTPLAKDFIFQEFFHSLFGGNHFHSGTGQGVHTFPWRTQPWGMSTQIGGAGVSLSPCGWDRWWLGWEPDNDANLIEAHDINNNFEVISDLSLPQSALNASQTFWLRDFVQTGDVIRIKLPFISGSIPGERPQKNQYLWLENHKLTSQFDHSNKYIYTQSTCDPIPLCGTDIGQGIWAAVQVGKDMNDGPSVYSFSPHSLPNALGSWMFPLFGDGFFDQAYGPYAFQTLSDPACSRNSISNDFLSADNKPNTFSGYSPIYGLPNTNNDNVVNYKSFVWTGVLRNPDIIQGCATFQSGSIINDLKTLGCSEFSFKCNTGTGCPISGKKILSLSSNPSPFGVLTRKSGNNYNAPNQALNETFENRAIWLSGLSVTILEEDPASSDMKINVKWDDYSIDNDVRWCADSIYLSPHIFDINNYSLNVTNSSVLMIDRGGSPTGEFAVEQINNKFVFAKPTIFTALPNSKIKVESGSKIVVDNSSLFHLMENSLIILEPNAEMIIKNQSELHLHSSSKIVVKEGAKLHIDYGAILVYYNGATIDLSENSSNLEITGNLNIISPAEFKTISSVSPGGRIVFNNPDLPSENISCIGGDCSIKFHGAGQNIEYLYVAQDGLYFKNGFANIDFGNCKVKMKTDARISIEHRFSNVTLYNVRLTSDIIGVNNGHNGLRLFGQGNVVVSNSIFEYGKYGIRSNNSVFGNSLNIYNCNFRNNVVGIKSFDKATNIMNSYFFNNEYGVLCTYMSYPSIIHEGLYGGNYLFANGNAIKWSGNGTAKLELLNPFINNNDVGVIVKGVPAEIGCGSISYNSTGLSMQHGSSLWLDDLSYMGSESKVTLFNNENSIVLTDALMLSLNKGYNDLQSSQDGQQKVVLGTLLPGGSNPIISNYNHWNLSGSLSTNDYNINSNSISIIDNSSLSSSILCGQAVPPCPAPPCNSLQNPLDYCPECEVINTDEYVSIKLNDAISQIVQQLLDADKTVIEAADGFAEILLVELDSLDSKEVYLLDLTYLKMLECVSKYIQSQKICDIDSGNLIRNRVVKIFEAIGVQRDRNILWGFTSRAFLTYMHEAQLLRMLGDRTSALDLLSNIAPNLTSAEESMVRDEFVCVLEIEHAYHSNQISLSDFDKELDLCMISQVATYRHAGNYYENNNSETLLPLSDSIWRIYPNPISSKILHIVGNVDKYQVKILNKFGNVIFEQNGSYESTFLITDIAPGAYGLQLKDTKSGMVEYKKIIIQN